MSNNQPIQFLLHQLTTNEQDRERFNLINKDFYVTKTRIGSNQFFYDIEDNWLGEIEIKEILENYQFAREKFIRTCLSRVNGEAVLGVFEGGSKQVKSCWIGGEINGIPQEECEYYLLSDYFYEVFDYPLRNGKPLDTTLHDKMLELVPKYREFLKNNK